MKTRQQPVERPPESEGWSGGREEVTDTGAAYWAAPWLGWVAGAKRKRGHGSRLFIGRVAQYKVLGVKGMKTQLQVLQWLEGARQNPRTFVEYIFGKYIYVYING